MADKDTTTPADDGEAFEAELLPVSYQGVEFPVRANMSPEAATARIMERLFASETIDDAFGVWEQRSSDALIGKVFTVNGASWGTYVNEAGEEIPLADVDALDNKGEKASFVTTAPNLTGFIALCEHKGWLPFTARIVGAKTKRGFTALHFERVEA